MRVSDADTPVLRKEVVEGADFVFGGPGNNSVDETVFLVPAKPLLAQEDGSVGTFNYRSLESCFTPLYT